MAFTTSERTNLLQNQEDFKLSNNQPISKSTFNQIIYLKSWEVLKEEEKEEVNKEKAIEEATFIVDSIYN